MPTVADLRVRFSADIGGALTGIRKVDDSVHRLQSSVNSALGGINFGQMFNVAGGNLIAAGIRNIASSVAQLGGEALTVYSDYERLTMSLETFAAQELIAAGGADSMSEALAMSGERAQEVLGWIENLAVQSPFEAKDISAAFRLAQAYGFTSDQAMRLTQATVDFAAGAGISGATMDRISLALGQIQARGKVSAQELNQLSESGINARQILANAFGVSTAKIMEMVEKGLVPADLAIEAITQTLEKDFGGAAKRQSATFSGLISSLSDLKSIGLREFFRGTFTAIQPSLQKFVEFVTNPAVKEDLRAWGDSIGSYIGGALAVVEERATRAMATFNLLSSQGDTIGGILAGVGQFTGADVTIDTKAKVTDVDWGVWDWTYDATSKILNVDWVGGLLGGEGGFTYDADAQVLGVDWTSSLGDGGMGFTYDATAGVTSVIWDAKGFKYNYNATAGVTSVNFAQGLYSGNYNATASVTGVLWGLYYGHYEANAGITDVIWGVYRHTYQPDAKITSVLWGAFTHSYITATEVRSVLWGLWSHSYNATANVTETSVMWGAYSHQYDATVRIGETGVLWGAYTHTYDAGARVGQRSILWGLWTNTYDAKAQVGQNSVLWGTWTWNYNAGVNILSKKTWADVFDFTLEWSPSVPSRLTWDNVFNFSLDWFPTINWPNPPAWVAWLMGGGSTSSPGGTHNFPRKPRPSNSNSGWDFNPFNNAGGTNYFRGGWTWVGEQGPELLHLPQGSQILSNPESRKMIGQLADGTTTAPTNWPGGGSTFAQNYDQRAADLGAKFVASGDKVATQIGRQMEAAAKKHRQELESALQSVPGLFGTSQITAQQMDMAALGVPQSFADDYVRRLTDEVVNGVDWEGVDIKDAAARAGIDPSLPAEAILTMFKDAWNDSSLFAGGKNTDLINQEAVQAALQRQAAAASGKDAINALFGITPEQATGQAVALGSSMRSGIEQGLMEPTASGTAGGGLLTGLTTVTPEQLAPVGVSIVDGLTAEMGKEEYADKIGAAFTKLFTGFLERKEALTVVGAQVMTRIAEGLGNASGIDMIGKFATAFRAQLALPDAIEMLHDVGARILEFVYQGYSAAAKEKDWPYATVGSAGASTVNPPPPASASTTAGASAAAEAEPAGKSRMALAGAGGPIVNVYATVGNGVDLYQLAYQVADIIQKRSRR